MKVVPGGVRTPYHPGALLAPLADLGDLLPGLHLENKPVVTYFT